VNDREMLERRDREDPLAAHRDRFLLADDLIYLDGNSLGPQLRGVHGRLTAASDAWRERLIRGWNDAGWVDLTDRIAARLAPLLGVTPAEVCVTDSTSVDLFQALVAARRLRPDRTTLLIEEGTFPTDRYVAGGVADLTGAEVKSVPRDRLAAAIDDTTAVVLASHVDYRTGHRHDGAAVTAAVHDGGALMVWDLAHSTGAVAVDLGRWRADFAVGCSYKYLNGGPGAPGYLVAAAHLDDPTPAIRGWFGHARTFDFAEDWDPAPGAARFRNGTPPVLSLTALEEALTVWEGVDPASVQAKAEALTNAFVALVDERCGEVEVVSPRDARRRGAQVSLRHPDAYAVMQALIARGVIGDHRPPDLLRFGFPPLTTRFVDVWHAVENFSEILATRAWDTPAFHRRNPVI
jgi:kynureninase